LGSNDTRVGRVVLLLVLGNVLLQAVIPKRLVGIIRRISRSGRERLAECFLGKRAKCRKKKEEVNASGAYIKEEEKEQMRKKMTRYKYTHASDFFF
jgi:hypothetical protein